MMDGRLRADKKTVGQRLSARREYLKAQGRPDMTQAGVARRLHLQRSTYAQYEAGINEMSVSDLAALAEILEVPVGYFFGEESEEEYADDETILYYRGLPPTLKPAARAAIKALYDVQDTQDAAVGRVGKKAE
ncbi:MAG: helix-turn-helix transcriptional regulator [Armatimonadetes bacterium]|nr:helix-turn-helix transcriptional regulator [Armatimonadota bacterium]